MKDSQLIRHVVHNHLSISKANNERFSTIDACQVREIKYIKGE